MFAVVSLHFILAISALLVLAPLVMYQRSNENLNKQKKKIAKIVFQQVTHWQHPRFHAYFPSGNSFPSILGDMLSDGIGAIGFSWVSAIHIQNYHNVCRYVESISMSLSFQRCAQASFPSLFHSLSIFTTNQPNCNIEKLGENSLSVGKWCNSEKLLRPHYAKWNSPFKFFCSHSNVFTVVNFYFFQGFFLKKKKKKKRVIA